MPLDHLGIAVHNLEAAASEYAPFLDRVGAEPELVPSQGVRVLFLEVGGTHLELLEPTSPDSAVGRFLERRGEGLHHLAFQVESVDSALAQVRERGGRLIDEKARPGARGHRVGFAHPSAFHGTLVEFVEGS